MENYLTGIIILQSFTFLIVGIQFAVKMWNYITGDKKNEKDRNDR